MSDWVGGLGAEDGILHPPRVDQFTCTHAIGSYVCARRSLPATPKQEELLRKRG